jgi:hypothetical protein
MPARPHGLRFGVHVPWLCARRHVGRVQRRRPDCGHGRPTAAHLAHLRRGDGQAIAPSGARTRQSGWTRRPKQAQVCTIVTTNAAKSRAKSWGTPPRSLAAAGSREIEKEAQYGLLSSNRRLPAFGLFEIIECFHGPFCRAKCALGVGSGDDPRRRRRSWADSFPPMGRAGTAGLCPEADLRQPR